MAKISLAATWRCEHGGNRQSPFLELVPGVGFEPTSPRLQRGAITRSASQALPPMLHSQRDARAGCDSGHPKAPQKWSGRRESNPRLRVGSAPIYH